MSAATRLGFDPAREEAELSAYLGEAYARADLERYEDLLEEEVANTGDEGKLYRTSRAYLYNLTAFAMTGTKLPYLEVLTSRVPAGARILDYGCGIGSDGLMLLEAGYRVEFADFANPSTEYLRWRLEHRSLEAPIYDLDDEVPGGFDAAYAFDVIEHVPDAHGFLREMEARARLVMVNLLEFGPNEQSLHYELPIKRLLGHAAGRRLEYYGLMHGTSHLVLYGPETVGRREKLRNAARIAHRATRARVSQNRPLRALRAKR